MVNSKKKVVSSNLRNPQSNQGKKPPLATITKESLVEATVGLVGLDP